MTDSTAAGPPRILHTKDEEERTKVLGYNHIRLTPADIRDSQARRAHRTSKWSRNLRYTLQGRMITSTRARFFFIWIICFAFSSFSLGLLWALGELIAGIAVASVFVALGCGLCGAAEFMIRCPRTVPSLLSDLGILKPIYDDDDCDYRNQEEMGQYIYEERGGGHYFPGDGGDRDLQSEYGDEDDGGEEMLRSGRLLEKAADVVLTKISAWSRDHDAESMSSPLVDSSGDNTDNDDSESRPLEYPKELLDTSLEPAETQLEDMPLSSASYPNEPVKSDAAYDDDADTEQEDCQDKQD